MTLSVRKNLGLALLPLVLLISSSAEAASAAHRCAWLFMHQVDLNRFFMKFRGDHLPFGATRASRAKDAVDLSLIKASYENENYMGPIEVGTVQLLDRKGNVIAGQRVYGSNGFIHGLDDVALMLLDFNSERIDEIATIRMRHTHPQESNGMVIPDVFSQGDMMRDKSFADLLARKPEYAGISYESWIIYLDQNIQRFYPEDLQLKHVRIRGYQLR